MCRFWTKVFTSSIHRNARHGAPIGSDAEINAQIQHDVDSDYLGAFNKFYIVVDSLSEEPLLCKLFIAVETQGEKIKKSLILDCKKSGFSRSSRKTERAFLSRVRDVVHDCLTSIAELHDTEEIELLVVDFEEAFWQFKLHPRERKFSAFFRNGLRGVRLFA